jgi:hypothetical protein
MSKGSGGIFFGTEECFCGGCTGCIVTTVTLIRPIDVSNQASVKHCAYGFLKYDKLCEHPKEKRCQRAKKWRIINLPTCQVIASGNIENGVLVGLKDRACYPMPYNNPCPNKGDFTFESILWPLILVLSYNLLPSLIDLKFLISILATIGIFGLHCDGDLSCRYVLQLQTAVECNGKIKWPNDPCVPNPASHTGIWNDVPDPEVP